MSKKSKQKRANLIMVLIIALIAAAGTIGVVIPPSVPMVLYAVIAEVSVNSLFKAGFVPGFIMGGILIAIALHEGHRHRYPKGDSFSLMRVFRSFLIALPGIMMPCWRELPYLQSRSLCHDASGPVPRFP